jgi:aspartate/methionine/tyrosine aminotransferase
VLSRHVSEAHIAARNECGRAFDLEMLCECFIRQNVFRMHIDIQCNFQGGVIDPHCRTDLGQDVDAPDVAPAREVGFENRPLHRCLFPQRAGQLDRFMGLPRARTDRSPCESHAMLLRHIRDDRPLLVGKRWQRRHCRGPQLECAACHRYAARFFQLFYALQREERERADVIGKNGNLHNRNFPALVAYGKPEHIRSIMHLSENVRGLEGSATLAIAALTRELRAQGREIIDLGVGEPDFRTPEFISAAGIAAIEQGNTQYTPVPGIAPLRQAIAARITNDTGHNASPDGVVVSSGAKQALFNACFTLFGPGDTVLVPVPFWTSYPALVRLARAETRYVPAAFERSFKITPADLDAAHDDTVRGLIINSPSNPAGTVYTKKELESIARWAAERDVWIISDEIYSRIFFAGERAASMLDLDDALLDKVVVVDGASKVFAMTGWRLGYSYSRTPLAKEMTSLQSQITSGASSPAQYAALAGYKDEARARPAVQAMVRVFQQRRDKVLAQLAADLPAAVPVAPEGAFYIFLKVDAFYTSEIDGSAAFCSWLLENTGIAAVPGSAFGDDRFIRMSLAAPNAALAEAVRRMGEKLSKAELAHQ